MSEHKTQKVKERDSIQESLTYHLSSWIPAANGIQHQPTGLVISVCRHIDSEGKTRRADLLTTLNNFGECYFLTKFLVVFFETAIKNVMSQEQKSKEAAYEIAIESLNQ